ncbi:MAG: DNA polymerase I [Acidobacteria bacterium]|nr:MAG: DNA polymerase I [Acidobacteriota bacterium]
MIVLQGGDELTKKTLYIIDGFAHIFRSFYAIKHIDNNAVYGFTMFLKKLLETENPDYIVVAMDSKEPSFRSQLYKPYKANRQAPPEPLVRQIPLVQEAIEAFGIRAIEKPGYEADDIMGTLAREAVNHDVQAVLVTGDKDLLQLVKGDQIVYHDPNKGNLFLKEQDVPGFFGCKANQIVDLLSIWGDASDNIPGVPGVGEKGAKSLIEQYGDIETIYENLDQIKRKAYRAGFEKARDSIELMKTLVTIKTDLNLEFDLESMKRPQWNQPCLIEFFKKMGFKSLIEQTHVVLSAIAKDYPLVNSESDLESWLNRIRQTGSVFFDLETSSLTPHDAQIAGISFALGAGDACYIPLRHKGTDQAWTDLAESKLKSLFEEPGILKCAHNLKYDYSVLTARGWNVSGPFDDSMLMSYLLEPRQNRHGLDYLAEHLLNYQTITFESVCGKGKDQIAFNELTAEQAVNYAAEDSDIGFQLWKRFQPQIEQRHLSAVYRDIERDLIPVLAKMELNGVLIDTDYLKNLHDVLEDQIAVLQGEIYALAGEEFNIKSPKQLGVIMFEKCGLPALGKTAKTKSYSTKQEVLEKLAARGYELPALLLQYRSLTKLQSTYVDKLPSMVHPQTGRIHSNFNQILTETGRLSSDNPNLQNIPIRTNWGRKIREAFIARPGYVLLAADYSQIELRLLAHFSEDPTLVKGFLTGEDIHRRTASEIFDTELSEVTDDQRRMAKSINFGLIYGMGAFRLSQELGITRKMATSYMETYFSKMKKVPEFTDRLIAETRQSGEVRTLFGRVREIPEIQSRNKSLQARGERLAVNTLIQGTAAELIKLAMINLDRALTEMNSKAVILMQVHDELVLECPLEEADRVARCLVETMETVLSLSVPLSVDVGRGPNWKEAKA